MVFGGGGKGRGCAAGEKKGKDVNHTYGKCLKMLKSILMILRPYLYISFPTRIENFLEIHRIKI